jgi:LacI family transcriptional regulator
MTVSDQAVGRPTSLLDVARAAGVSKATASRALNAKEGVSPYTRQRVRDIADSLGFSPSAVARNLTAGRTGTVGILTNDLDGRFVLPILAGAEDTLAAGDISVILCDARGETIREQSHLKTLLERRVDGLLVVAGARTDPRPPLGHEIPVPVVYAYAPSTGPNDRSVITDNTAAGRLAAEHMWDIGRRQIAYIGGDPTFVADQEREAGARAALADHGIDLIVDRSQGGDWTERWGRRVVTNLLDQAPQIDGIIAAADALARAALDILRDRCRPVPDDVAVMGFDNWTIFTENTRPELTSIDLELQAMGRRAAGLLFAALSGETLEPGIEYSPVRLVVRDSTIREP